MRRPNLGDDDTLPVIVPRNEKALAPTSPERMRRLREHLVAALRASRMIADPAGSASPLTPEPEGFAARVAHAACSLCRGWCCKGGGDHAYLDRLTMARVRRDRPEMDDDAILRLYSERAPAIAYEGSCLFHGKAGCNLDRSLRSDICNSYFCDGLDGYLKGGDAKAHVVVIAGEGEKMRTSSVLSPPGR
jgi:hypothetical protein